MNEKQSLPEVQPPRISHEPASINGRMIGLCGLSLLTIIAVALLASGELRRLMTPTASRSAAAAPIARSTEAALLNPQQQKTRSHYEAEQRERLSTYGWVDQSKGKVHIPIDRAMSILVQKNRRDK
ncbi:MAG: hypothetical protein JWP89_2325 [Schlesneria sp.]|nr:hypothetical protein [Schlesneria sp.]